MVTDLSGWIQAGVAGLVAAAGTFFWAGGANQHLEAVQVQVQRTDDAQRADHDKVTAQEQQLKDIQSDVSEIKSDVKHLLEHQKR